MSDHETAGPVSKAPSSRAAPDSYLEIVIGSEAGRIIRLTPGRPLTIGRGPTCNVRLDDEAVSREHCRIDAVNGSATVIDLQSANGTLLNGDPIEKSPLRAGDELLVGTTPVLCRKAVVKETAVPVLTIGTEPATSHATIRRRVESSTMSWLSSSSERRPHLVERVNRHLRIVHMVSELFSQAEDVPALFESILATIVDVTNADRTALLLCENGSDEEPRLAATRARHTSGEVEHFRVSRSVVSDVMRDGLSVFSHDTTADKRYRKGASLRQQRVRSMMCVPVRTTEAVLGALYVDSHDRGRFSQADLELLAAVGNLAGVALHRATLLADLERFFLDAVRAIVTAIDAKDGYTHAHSERVALLAARLAHALGWSKHQQETARLSALLHDLSKIGLPDALLNKPGPLTEEELAETRKHPAHGARILSQMSNSRVAELIPGVLYHHERWNGSGYPEGLREQEIPLLGRLIGVADFLAACTSKRAYRPAFGFRRALDLLREGRGTLFDPQIVDVALALDAQGELITQESEAEDF